MPANLIILTVLITALVGLFVVLMLSRAVSRLTGDTRRWPSVLFAAVVALWYLIRFSLGFSMTRSGVLLVILSFVVTFSLAGLSLLIPLFRKAIWSLPQRWLIGVQSARVGGFIFLGLLDMHLLPPGFALPAGYGDVLVGLLAPVVVYVWRKKKPYRKTVAVAWNVLGLVDLLVALTTGIIFIAPYMRQLVAVGQSIDFLNYVLLIPGFAVPLLILVHVLSLAKMFVRERKPSVR